MEEIRFRSCRRKKYTFNFTFTEVKSDDRHTFMKWEQNISVAFVSYTGNRFDQNSQRNKK